jgi:ubiquinone/menaquinone biosynthesis C-methylase UbiE
MALAAATRAGVLVGIDPSAWAIAAANRRHRRMVRAGRMVFTVGTAEATSQADDSCDLVYSVNTVYFWPNLEAALAEINRVLKPGGLFLNALYTPRALAAHPHTEHYYRKYEPEALVAATGSQGFTAEARPYPTSHEAFCVRAVKQEASGGR